MSTSNKEQQFLDYCISRGIPLSQIRAMRRILYPFEPKTTYKPINRRITFGDAKELSSLIKRGELTAAEAIWEHLSNQMGPVEPKDLKLADLV